MVDELEQAENLSESPPGGENPPEVEELGAQEGVTELENLVAQKDEELTRTNARLTELEEVIAGKDGEIADLKQTGEKLEEKLTTLNNSLAESVASYKAMVVQANPEVIGELISGDTIESINESLDEAKALDWSIDKEEAEAAVEVLKKMELVEVKKPVRSSGKRQT